MEAAAKDVDSVMAAIYSAAGDDGEWGEALTLAADWLGAADIHYFVLDRRTNAVRFLANTGRFAGAPTEDYIREWASRDPRAGAAIGGPVGAILTCHRLFDDEFVGRDPFYNEYLMPLGLRWSVGAKLYEEPDMVAVVGVHRRQGEAPFGGETLAAAERVIAHIGHAARLHARFGVIRDRLAATQAMADGLGAGILVLDGTGRLLAANAAAEEMLGRDDGGLTVRGGRLAGAGPGGRDAVAVILRIGRPDGATPGGMLIPRASGRPDYRLAVWPLAETAAIGVGDGMPRILLVMLDPDRQTRSPVPAVAACYGLTMAETALLQGLSEGEALADLAARRGVQMSTIRTQLSSVLAKCGARSQSDLIRHLGEWPAMRPGGVA